MDQLEALQLAGWLNAPDTGVNEKRRELMAAPCSDGANGEGSGLIANAEANQDLFCTSEDAGEDYYKRCLVQFIKKKLKKKTKYQRLLRETGEAIAIATAENDGTKVEELEARMVAIRGKMAKLEDTSEYGTKEEAEAAAASKEQVEADMNK